MDWFQTKKRPLSSQMETSLLSAPNGPVAVSFETLNVPAELQDTRHFRSKAACTSAIPQQSLEDQLAEDNLSLEEVSTDQSASTVAVTADQSDLSEDEQSVASLEASQVVGLAQSIS